MKENIIPADAEFTLNIRTFDEDFRTTVLDGAFPRKNRTDFQLPRCYNDPAAANALIDASIGSTVTVLFFEVPPVMGSQDFGLLAEAIGIPSVYWMFGAYSQERIDRRGQFPGNQAPYFAPDIEPTLTTGVRAALTSLLSKVGK
ncbi:metal-dependent amidase/aminoacylase/carboxypeptidase family protein [Arthrobacter sp. GAS37]|uniref:hypothetical protein n=1 Tax=Arthrobacter sp. GAS37 TaxID=3156261 RepID=UPI00383422DA